MPAGGLLDFVFDSEQKMLRDMVRDFLADRAPMQQVRIAMETDAGFDEGLWAELADLGMLGVHVPETDGGTGLSFRELGIVMEELGRALTPIPVLSTVVLGAGAIMLAGSPAQHNELLPQIAAGALRLAVAVGDSGLAGEIGCTSQPAGDGVSLTGEASYVVDGHTADLLVVAAHDGSGAASLYLVPGDAPGVTRSRLETMDMTRRLAAISLDRVTVAKSALLGEPGSAPVVIDGLLDQAVAALASEQLGGAQMCLEAAVAYAKVRHQFGRPIGSFQAIKHKCADMLVRVESARSAAYHASWAAAEDPVEFRVAAPLAKASCSDSYLEVAAENIQVHGGIGFTWEHDAHLHLKRAKSTQLLFGAPSRWREVLADRLEL